MMSPSGCLVKQWCLHVVVWSGNSVSLWLRVYPVCSVASWSKHLRQIVFLKVFSSHVRKKKVPDINSLVFFFLFCVVLFLFPFPTLFRFS